MTTKTVNLHHKIEFLPSMVRTIAINLCSSDLSREWRKSNNIKEPIKFGECFYTDLLHEDHVRIIDQLMILEYKHRKAGRKEEMKHTTIEELREMYPSLKEKNLVSMAKCLNEKTIERDEVDFKDAGMSVEEFAQQFRYTNKPKK